VAARRSDETKAGAPTITDQIADPAVDEATNALHYKARRRHVRRILDDLALLVTRKNCFRHASPAVRACLRVSSM
jgi:hypothetical protein